MATIPITGKITVPSGKVTGTFTVNPGTIVGGSGAITGTADLDDAVFAGTLTFDDAKLLFPTAYHVLITGQFITYTMRTTPPPLHMIGSSTRTGLAGQLYTCTPPSMGMFSNQTYPVVQLTSGPYNGLYVRTTDPGVLFY